MLNYTFSYLMNTGFACPPIAKNPSKNHDIRLSSHSSIIALYWFWFFSWTNLSPASSWSVRQQSSSFHVNLRPFMSIFVLSRKSSSFHVNRRPFQSIGVLSCQSPSFHVNLRPLRQSSSFFFSLRPFTSIFVLSSQPSFS